MQVLKEELRDKIIQKAIKEFMEHGFEKASLRKIVREAGTTIGNFYNYFKSKEDVFYAITTPVYDSVIHLMKNHSENDELDLEAYKNMNFKVLKQFIVGFFKNYIRDYGDIFVILIDGSKGTRYVNMKEDLLTLMTEHFQEHLDETPSWDKSLFHKDLPSIIAAGFLEGILEILRGDRSGEEKEGLLVEYILLYAFGVIKMLDGMKA
ncbi:MAG: TetR/AcrR family transcriptional regulator [Clostridia bacterium]|nr:TetR/AcrR family transcriptional regulator [Clostridia bacterium]